MKTGTKLHIVGIDCQMDFCTPNGTYNVPTGALYVPGADEDMKRFAKMIRRIKDKIFDLHFTLDQHHALDVAHPPFWKNSKGENPSPFTIITANDVESGVWTPAIPSLYQRMLKYVKALEASKRYPLMIWPPHCLIGSPGAAIVPELFEAINDWATSKQATIDFVTKGSNVFTEHYSAVQAEVPDPNDPSTHLNKALIQTIEEADMVVWAGEASSHCVLNTMVDCFKNFGTDAIKKMVLLTDATSAVTGCDKMFDDFLKEYTAKGMQTSTTVDFLA